MIVVHPNEYAVYNGVVIDAVNKLIEEGEIDFGVEKLTKSNFVRTYKKFNEFAKKLANENGLTLWELDWVWFAILNPDREPTLGHDDEPFFYDSTNLRIQNYPEEPEIRVPKLELPLNLILYGPVGTGKTTIANTLGRGIVNGRITNFTQLENLISGKEEFEDLKANGKEYSENIEIILFGQLINWWFR